ncbi:hypothetical protein PoB_000955000 [Plakobranchus ocellatus]|uniref:Uncharacterized protein n=1 Tax=Plakobranchus ocellatus TaxID=259542 RepID=A0AAV3YIY0_9GAST|nr:hypothetical protein PoB_000955000 [Plakobranchus ocellatus]
MTELTPCRYKVKLYTLAPPMTKNGGKTHIMFFSAAFTPMVSLITTSEVICVRPSKYWLCGDFQSSVESSGSRQRRTVLKAFHKATKRLSNHV